jgi:hypothetical protein
MIFLQKKKLLVLHLREWGFFFQSSDFICSRSRFARASFDRAIPALASACRRSAAA